MSQLPDFLDSTLLFAQLLGRIAEFLIPVIIVLVLVASGYLFCAATPHQTDSLCRYCEHRDQADRAVCTACITRRA